MENDNLLDDVIEMDDEFEEECTAVDDLDFNEHSWSE